MDLYSLYRLLLDRLAFVLRESGGRLWGLLQAEGLRNAWIYFALAFILTNLKSLPTIWHLRFFHGLMTHLRSRRPPSDRWRAADIGPRALFRPLIISSHSPLMECDLNGHKSNSVYFSDLDISRTHLLSCLLQRGMQRTHEQDGVSGHFRYAFILGAVSCVFRAEIKPYERFEIWSRVLSWDRKWIYVVSHFVRKGAVRPREYMLQPDGPRRWWWLQLFDPFVLWRRQKRKGKTGEGAQLVVDGSSVPAPAASTAHPAIYASAISKYVVKRGRRTVPPEQVFENSGVCPPRPASSEAEASSSSSSTPPEDQSVVAPVAAGSDGQSAVEALTASLLPDSPPQDGGENDKDKPDADVWDWARVEKERQRGMQLATLLADMDALHGAFTGGDSVALGEYNDLF